MSKKYTTEEFIEKSKIVHGDKYNYSKVEYINSTHKVCIICPEHGEFWQQPQNHIQGQNCPICGRLIANSKTSKSKQDFIDEANKVHKNKYTYDKVNYINTDTKIIITCPKHGDFLETPYLHLKGHGCKKCSNVHQYTTKEFIEKGALIHHNKYDYSKTNYINSRILTTIICPHHGEFLQQPIIHLSGHGCLKCGYDTVSTSLSKTTEEFITQAQKVHKNLYDYSNTIYTGEIDQVEIICKKHGAFLQCPKDHLSGSGCPKCKLKSQNKLYNKLSQDLKCEILFEAGKSLIPWIKRFRLDLYIPEYNIAIEYDGIQHFKQVDYFKNYSLQLTKRRDAEKEQLCLENNCKLFRIKYDYSDEEYANLVNNIKQLIT